MFSLLCLLCCWVLLRYVTYKYNYWKRHECLTQHQLEEKLRGPEFELDTRYGEQSVVPASLPPLMCNCTSTEAVHTPIRLVTCD